MTSIKKLPLPEPTLKHCIQAALLGGVLVVGKSTGDVHTWVGFALSSIMLLCMLFAGIDADDESLVASIRRFYTAFTYCLFYAVLSAVLAVTSQLV